MSIDRLIIKYLRGEGYLFELDEALIEFSLIGTDFFVITQLDGLSTSLGELQRIDQFTYKLMYKYAVRCLIDNKDYNTKVTLINKKYKGLPEKFLKYLNR